jgi:catechol 2,3-dioxygenase-like lactoylglutathione lyase family enzyme
MMQLQRIGHATFETPDLERQIDYYTQVVVGCRQCARSRSFDDPNAPEILVGTWLTARPSSEDSGGAYQINPALERTKMVAPGHLHFGKCPGIHGVGLPN